MSPALDMRNSHLFVKGWVSPALAKLALKPHRKGGVRSAKGFTLIEFIMMLVVVGTLASAFVVLAIPEINLFFFLPQRIRVHNALSDFLDTVIEGDASAKGLRFAQTITAATATSLTYTYTTLSSVTHTIVINYSVTSHTVTRSIDGAPAMEIPYYLKSGSGILVDPLETNFFRYYAYGGAEMTGGGIIPANIYLVVLPASAKTGTGKVTESEGMTAMKSGVEIKHYGLPEIPDI